MVAAGNDTTRYTMTAGAQVFIERPEIFAALPAMNEAEIKLLVDEVLRWASTTMHFRRTVVEDTELRGQVLDVYKRQACTDAVADPWARRYICGSLGSVDLCWLDGRPRLHREIERDCTGVHQTMPAVDAHRRTVHVTRVGAE